ncbi:MAG: transposase [Candidatus Dadabacteria bacterium]|nr:transposase [Candidatus Dadabacteria bacterium]MDE0291154.1 transposase [Candidatus Dadabacteria bacterium]MDE0477568.1 transposase [Candidatus Dadabacteria bacterium]
MIRTYKCRAKLTRSGHEALSRVFGMCATLYNACLEERIDCYKKTGESRSYYDQCKALTEVRADDPEYDNISVQVFRGVVGRMDKAYKRFFKHGGFPRFKSSRRWRTIEINDQCWKMLKREGQKLFLKIKGLPRIEVKTERELPPNALLKAIRITRKPLRTEVALSYELPTPDVKPENNPVGIDMGISKRLALSNGETVEKREMDRRKLIRLQRSISRKKKGSNNRRKAVSLLAKEWQRLTEKERNYLHRLTSEIVRMYDFIAIEKLETKKMLGNRQLARSIQEQTWGKFATLLNEKAESAGVTVVAVNPEGTSQECSNCGARVEKSLSVRIHRCTCGYEADRDLNAAINILHRGILIAGGKLKQSRMVGRMREKQGVPLARPRTVEVTV